MEILGGGAGFALAVGALDLAALAVAPKDAAIFFLPIMLKEFLGAVTMARREQGGR